MNYLFGVSQGPKTALSSVKFALLVIPALSRSAPATAVIRYERNAVKPVR